MKPEGVLSAKNGLALVFILLSAAIGGLASAGQVRAPLRSQLDGGNGTAYGDGGPALPARAEDGFPGMPGCDGGTNPSKDGKFYIPETGQECNPSDQDRRKLK